MPEATCSFLSLWTASSTAQSSNLLNSKGITDAKKKIKRMLFEFADSLGDDFDVEGIEVEASFNADGKFLGFGAGGAVNMKIRVKPAE